MDEWKFVTNKKKSNKKSKTKSVITLPEDDIKDLRVKYSHVLSFLKKSAYWSKVKQDIFNLLKKFNQELIQIICLGLGNPTNNKDSLYQLAFLNLLCEEFNEFVYSSTLLYDPIFTDLSKRFIKDLKFMISSSEINGDCPITSPTFIFMPHCPHFLTKNILLSNWSIENLSHLIFFSNSWSTLYSELTAYESEYSEEDKLNFLPKLRRLMKLDAIQIRETSSYKTKSETVIYSPFENLDFHLFKTDILASLPNEEWRKVI